MESTTQSNENADDSFLKRLDINNSQNELVQSQDNIIRKKLIQVKINNILNNYDSINPLLIKFNISFKEITNCLKTTSISRSLLAALTKLNDNYVSDLSQEDINTMYEEINFIKNKTILFYNNNSKDNYICFLITLIHINSYISTFGLIVGKELDSNEKYLLNILFDCFYYNIIQSHNDDIKNKIFFSLTLTNPERDLKWFIPILECSYLPSSANSNNTSFSGFNKVKESEINFNSIKKSNFIYRIKISLGDNSNKDITTCLLKSLISKNTSFQQIDLSGNNLNKQLSIIKEDLKLNKTIQSLNLKSTQLDETDCEVIKEVLEYNSSIKKIDIEFNNIDDEGFKLISEALLTNTTLTDLIANKNKISDVGMKYFCMSMIYNECLKHISLNNNFITDKGLNKLGLVLSQDNTSLEDIHLGFNLITLEGSRQLIENLYERLYFIDNSNNGDIGNLYIRLTGNQIKNSIISFNSKNYMYTNNLTEFRE